MELKHPMTVVLMKEEHERLVRVAQADDRPPARLARMLINEGLKKRERVIESGEDYLDIINKKIKRRGNEKI